MTTDTYLTVPEVAQLLGTSTKTVYKYIKDKQLVATKYGRGWKITEADVENFINAQKNINQK